MIRLILPLILLMLGLGGGIAAGLMLGGADGDGEAAASESGADLAEDEDTDAAAEAEEEGGAQAGSGVRVTPGSTDELEYVRLNNQFIVPIVRHGSVRSLVVMSLTLEVAVGQNEAVFSREPRLRDAFLRVMFAHANAGGFDGSFTSALAMDPLREGLREAARGILGPIVNDVLIVDIVRQDA